MLEKIPADLCALITAITANVTHTARCTPVKTTITYPCLYVCVCGYVSSCNGGFCFASVAIAGKFAFLLTYFLQMCNITVGKCIYYSHSTLCVVRA